MSRRARRRRKQPSQRKENARRRQSPGQREPAKPDLGTPQLRAHRRHAGFSPSSPATYDETLPMEFPLAIMKSRGLINAELHDAGMRFGALAWSLYGEPFAGCEALYERMLTSGTMDRGPRIEADPGKAAERQQKRTNLHEMMLAALQRYDPELGQPIESGRMRRIVVDVVQYCRSPRWLVATIAGERYRLSDGIERDLLMQGLGRLANLERQQTPRRAA